MIISISNQKGGVGKTTSTINIGAYLALLGYKVLLIDLDPQCNLSISYGIKDSTKNIYGAILGDSPISESIVFLENIKGTGKLALIPGSKNFARYEKIRANEVNSQLDLKKCLQPIQNHFDYIIIDCPPTMGLIAINAFACSRAVLVPLEAQLFAIEGLKIVSKLISEVKEVINPEIKLGGIFFIKYDKRKILDREIQNFIEENYKEKLLNASIRESIALREAPHECKDIFAYDANSNGAKDYILLTNELIEKL
jgi:chromosome partitioning protein